MAVVEEGRPMVSSLRDALQAQLIADAAVALMQAGRAVTIIYMPDPVSFATPPCVLGS